MKLAALAALTTATVLASGGTARAGGYLGLGVGTEAAVHGDDGAYEGAGRSYRLLGGLRAGRLSLEASITGQDLLARNVQVEGRQVALAGRYSFPLQAGLEAYAKLGAHRTWLRSDSLGDLEGDGLLVGGGVELRLDALLASGSLFLDYTHHAADFSGDRASFGGGLGMWMLGFTIGI